MKLQNNLFDLTKKQTDTSMMMYNKIIKCLVAPYHTEKSLSIDYAPNIFMFPEKELSHIQTKNFISMVVNSKFDEVLIITSSIDIILDMVDDCVRILTENNTIVDCPEKTFCANQHTIIYSILNNKDHKKSETEKSLNRDKINIVIEKLNTHTCTADEYDEMSTFIENIGETIVKTKMRNMLHDMKIVDKFSSLTQECIDFMIEKDWYTNNEKVSNCIEICGDVLVKLKKKIKINEELLSLYKSDITTYSVEIKKCEQDIKDSKLEYKIRQTIEEWLGKQNKTAKIQDCLNKLKKGV